MMTTNKEVAQNLEKVSTKFCDENNADSTGKGK